MEATKKVFILSPEFYKLQAQICEEWAKEFQRISGVCLEWAVLLEKAEGTNTEWIVNYKSWSDTFAKQARVCLKQASMAREAGTKIILPHE